MKQFKIWLILLAIFAIHTSQASTIKRRDVLNDADGDGIDDDLDDAIDIDGDSTEVMETADTVENVDNGDDEKRDLQIVSIKSRVVTSNRNLCRELSRYHPHYPKCQLYCENLKHWMGMCRRDNCHCYS